MGRLLWDRLNEADRAREVCFLAGQDPDESVAGYLVDAAGQRHWCRKARWRWYADAVTAAPAPVEGQDNGVAALRPDAESTSPGSMCPPG